MTIPIYGDGISFYGDRGLNRAQLKIISESGSTEPRAPIQGSKIGIAIPTLRKSPINSMRHNPCSSTNGWYVSCGAEFSDDPSFFSPLHVEHVPDYLPEVVEYLDLPLGYRFLINGSGDEDI